MSGARSRLALSMTCENKLPKNLPREEHTVSCLRECFATESDESPPDEMIVLLIATLDKAAEAILEFEQCFRNAVANRQTGVCVLDLRIDRGVVKESYFQWRRKFENVMDKSR